jgi:DHA1 family bicyclomycin/chloramphenicol resistance-like MFS transporter
MLIDARSRSFIVILIALTMASPVALTMYVPVMPAIAEGFNTDFGTIQWSLTVYLVAVALGQLAYGPLSDVFGRLPVLKAGLFLFFLSSLILAFLPTIPLLIGGRAIQGLGACSGMVLARAMIRDAYGKDKTAVMLAYVSMGFAIGPAIAPFIGGLLSTRYGWQSIFFVLTIYAALLVLASLSLIPETLNRSASSANPRQIFKSYGKLIQDGRFQSLTIASACLSAGFFGFIGGAAFLFADDLGLGPEYFGMSMMALVAFFILGNFLSTRLPKRLATQTIMNTGYSILALSAALWFIFYLDGTITVTRVILPMLLFSLGRGISEPFLVASCLNLHPKIAGSAAGYLGFFQLTISGLFTIIVPQVMGVESRNFYLIIGVVTFASVCIYGLYRYIDSTRTPGQSE